MTTETPPTRVVLATRYDEVVRRVQQECRTSAEEVEPDEVAAFWRYVDRHDQRAHRRTRVVFAALLALLGVAGFNLAVPTLPARTCPCNEHIDVAVVLALPAVAIVLSLLLLRSRTASGQMLLRALLWSTALLGALASVLEPDVVPITSACAGVVCGGALLILGRHGLEPERYTGSFAPVAHRDALSIMLILAVADAQTLVAWTNGSYWESPAAGLCGLAMTAGIIGLSRLKVWGLLLNTLMSAGIAGMALLGLLDLPAGVVAMLTSTAAVQVLLAALVLRSVQRGTPTELPLLARWGFALVWLAIAATMATSVAGLLFATP